MVSALLEPVFYSSFELARFDESRQKNPTIAKFSVTIVPNSYRVYVPSSAIWSFSSLRLPG